MTTHNQISQDNPRAWRNPWVIGLVSLIAIVLAVNIFMISLAFITSPGLVVEDYYEQGRNYEQDINEKLAAWNALGWTVQSDFPPKPKMLQKENYRVTLVDKNGQPLTEAQVRLKAYRPSDADADFSQIMTEIYPGIYETQVSFQLKGAWELNVYIDHGEDSYQTSSPVFVSAP